jgi:endonuclease YncB( thermonuclease family)
MQESICAPLRKLEKAARAQKRGMWADRTSAAPREWTLIPGGAAPAGMPGSAPR